MASDQTKPIAPASGITLALRAPQAAKALGISPRLLATLTAQRRVPFARINTVVVYPLPELQRWLSDEAAKEGQR